MLWLGAATPLDGMGQAMDYVTTKGGERGRDGWVWCPSCSPTLGIALKMAPWKGWIVGLCPSPPWWHYCDELSPWKGRAAGPVP